MKQNIIGNSEFEKAIIIALGVVSGQKAKLIDGESNIWESVATTVGEQTHMLIYKNGTKVYLEIYYHNLGESKEFFY